MGARDQASDQLAGLVVGGTFAGRFRIDGVLGVGAMGKVYRATELARRRGVALKVLHRDTARREEVLQRFRREAAIMAQLRHPGIARIFESGRTAEGIDYLTMEVLEGRTLREHLNAHGALSPRQLAPLVVAIADALAAAHAKGIVHRDLKPDNVFLCASGEIKVVDFGLSMLDVERRITKTGVMIGTPRYMAPEQIRSAKDVDPRIDIYALGVLSHEALTNASPFPAKDAAELLGCIISGRFVRIEEQRGDLPPGLGDVLRRAVATDRRDRFATISAFAEAFSRVVGVSMHEARELGMALASSAEPAMPEPVAGPLELERPRFTLPEPPPPPPKRSRVPTALALLVALGALVACLSVGLLYYSS